MKGIAPQGCQILSLDLLLFGFDHFNPLSPFETEMGPMERLALSWGKRARQFTKLLLSLLSHIGKIGGSPRIRTAFSPVKSRDFTIKVRNPK